MSQSYATADNALELCSIDDLVPNAGVAALVGAEQIALFYLPNENPCIYALGNYDPIGHANVMSRGILGDIDGRLVIASPLYKQHFDLQTGQCLEQTEHVLPVYTVDLRGERVLLYR